MREWLARWAIRIEVVLLTSATLVTLALSRYSCAA
jgi:hypothetical protein